MKQHWLYYLSPCILASVYCVIELIAGLRMGEWGIFFMLIFGSALFILLSADLFVKAFSNGKVLRVWLIEIVVVVILIICYSLYF
jgi:hypothetical protein